MLDAKSVSIGLIHFVEELSRLYPYQIWVVSSEKTIVFYMWRMTIVCWRDVNDVVKHVRNWVILEFAFNWEWGGVIGLSHNQSVLQLSIFAREEGEANRWVHMTMAFANHMVTKIVDLLGIVAIERWTLPLDGVTVALSNRKPCKLLSLFTFGIIWHELLLMYLDQNTS